VNGLLPPDHGRGRGFAVIEKKIVHTRLEKINLIKKYIYTLVAFIYIQIIIKNKNR